VCANNKNARANQAKKYFKYCDWVKSWLADAIGLFFSS
jgi:hypothetical protein